MSLALIQESAKEVRRLSIAGSPLAVGDFRLKKLIAPLETAGAKVPVFAQVAKAISDLVNGTEAESATRLLSLSTLLNAILYTQGQSSADAPFAEMEVFSTKCSSTRTTARVLKPLIQALSSSGGGRFEIVKSAHERGAFNDLRLIDPAIRALGDSYPELADLVAEKILPAYGPGIAPRLKENLDLKGKRECARRLTVLHAVDPAGTVELCKTALDDGSVDVKAAAISCLGKHEECLPLVQEQASSKNKALRAAALEALAAHDRPEITSLFRELLKGKDLDILAASLRVIRNRDVLRSLVAEGKRVFELLLKGDSEAIPRFGEILNCMHQRVDPECQEFLLGCLNQCEKIAKLKAAKNSPLEGPDVIYQIAELVEQIGTPEALQGILAKRAALPPMAFTSILRSALRTWSPDKVFDEFSPLLDQKKGAAKEKAEEIERTIWTTRNEGALIYYDFTTIDPEEQAALPKKEAIVWDDRWVDAAVKANRPLIVCCLVKPAQKQALAYLSKLAEDKGQAQCGFIIQALARCQYPKVTDIFMDLVAKKTKGARYIDYELQLLLGSARHLPATDLPRLDEFAAKLDEKFMDPYLEAIAPLRPPRPLTAAP